MYLFTDRSEIRVTMFVFVVLGCCMWDDDDEDEGKGEDETWCRHIAYYCRQVPRDCQMAYE